MRVGGEVVWQVPPLSVPHPAVARAKALAHAGLIAWERLDFGRSTALSEEALALSRELGYKEGAAAALYSLGMVAIYDQMSAEDAWSRFEECLVLRRELKDEVGMARTLQKMGLIMVMRRDFKRAQAVYEEATGLVQWTGDKVGRVVTLWLGGSPLWAWATTKAWRVCAGKALT